MSILFKGIMRHETDISSDYGRSQYAQNLSFTRVGEIYRRPGIGKTDMDSLVYPINNMCAGWFDVPYLVSVFGGQSIDVKRNPTLLWKDIALVPPAVAIAQPVAPVITNIAYNITVNNAPIYGEIEFLFTVTYDGLSGALQYNTVITDPFGISQDAGVNPLTLGYFGTFVPGTYPNTAFTVSTQFNAFTSNQFVVPITIP